jgi:ABC-type nitrate/sulfonate/bicarbonate transport system substrate-binding protein
MMRLNRHTRESFMRMLRSLTACAAALVFVLSFFLDAARAESDKIRVGKAVGGSGFHIPSYLAMDKGFYKAEGLDAQFVVLQARALVTAGLSANVDLVPIPSGGAQAALSGAPITYVVGESLKSQWTIVVPKSIDKIESLRGKTLGYGRPGSADYDEGALVLQRFFHMEAGRDYKVISFQGEADRVGALINGDIQGALISVPHAARATAAGMKVLLRTGDYIARAGGSIWCMQEFVDRNPETVKKFIRAIAKAVMYFRADKAGSLATLKDHLGIDNIEEAGLVWDELHNAFGAELPEDLFREILESRRQTMIAARQWPADKPLPDPEQFVARKLLDSTLKEMGYVPTKLEAPSR